MTSAYKNKPLYLRIGFISSKNFSQGWKVFLNKLHNIWNIPIDRRKLNEKICKIQLLEYNKSSIFCPIQLCIFKVNCETVHAHTANSLQRFSRVFGANINFRFSGLGQDLLKPRGSDNQRS